MRCLLPSLVALLLSTTILSGHTVTSGLDFEEVEESGYITIPGYRQKNGSHLFYWYFGSRSNPALDPFIIWLSGGPGCSSVISLLTGHGPFTISKDHTISKNIYSWNEFANTIWIDEPTGTGFSYADDDEDYVNNLSELSIDFYQFLQAFFLKHPDLANRSMYITGESYAGHTLPAIATYIIDMNKNGKNPIINLKGIAIGNGWTDPSSHHEAYANFMYDQGLISKRFTEYINNEVYPLCADAIVREDVEDINVFCIYEKYALILYQSGKRLKRSINLYDIRAPCITEYCYEFELEIAWLANPERRKQLGIDPNFDFEECSSKVYQKLHFATLKSGVSTVAYVLDSGINVLLYSGEYDYLANSYSSLKWTREMEWSGQDGYNSASKGHWFIKGQSAGYGYAYKNLIWLELERCGHIAPMDSPLNVSAMIYNWVNDQLYFSYNCHEKSIFLSC